MSRETVVEGVANLERELKDSQISQDTLVVMARTANGYRAECLRLSLPTVRLDQVQQEINRRLTPDSRKRIGPTEGTMISGKDFKEMLKSGGTLTTKDGTFTSPAPAPVQATDASAFDPNTLPTECREFFIETIGNDEQEILDDWRNADDDERLRMYNVAVAALSGASGGPVPVAPSAPTATTVHACASCGHPISDPSATCSDCGYEPDGDGVCKHENKMIDEDTGLPYCVDCGHAFKPVVTHNDRTKAINDLFGTLR